MGYGLPRSSGGNGGSRENCLGIPESFSLSCSKRALTSASVRYWALVPPPTADPPSGWVLSWLPTEGALSLTSYVLPSLRRRTSCCKSFNIAVIRATGSDSCLAFLCSNTTFCSVKGTSPLCLEATSFSPTGSKAAGGILAPLVFLGLGGMLCEGIISSLFFTQSPVESPKCGSAFFFLQHSGLGILGQIVMGLWTGLGSPQLRSCLRTKWCTGQASYNTNKLTNKDICIE